MNGVLKWMAAALAGGSLQCGMGAELPVETFFQDYHYNLAKLSPDGDSLAVLAPVRKRVGLVVVDLKNRTSKCAYADRSADVHWFEWANTNRLVFRFTKDAYLVRGLMAVNRDGSRLSTLIHFGDSRTAFFQTLPNSPDEILVTSTAYSVMDFQAGQRFPHVTRMNLFSGTMTREVTNPGRVFRWLTDHNSVVRVGVAYEEDDQLKVIYRAGTNAAWQTIAQFRYNQDGIDPMGFDYDNQTLFVGHCGGRDTEGVYKFDVAAKQIKELGFCHAEADVERLWFSAKERALAGVFYDRERPEVFWFNQKYRQMQASVDQALPGTLNVLTGASGDGTKALFLARSDRAPGTYYLLNPTTLKMEKLFDTAEWLDPEQMAAMKPIQYRARDGLTIHGYLTLPTGSSGKNVPLIVNPHGGPSARDVWGFDPEVQFLANRGYAVLRMNFRGSTGVWQRFP